MEADERTGAADGSDKRISATRVMAAGHQKLFDIVANPAMHPVIDGSGSVKSVRTTSTKLGPGDKFSVGMRIGVPYLITNRVVEFEEGRLIAWAHVGGWRWRWEFEPVDDATRVTETFDWSMSRASFYVTMMGWPRKNADNLERTLDRLEAYVSNKTSAS